MRTAIALVAAFLFLAVPPAASAADFLSGTEDVPLMAGLVEQGDGAVVFDTADGRIVEVTTTGTPSPAAVRAFYAETLPQLGWHAEKGDTWQREDEELRLTFPAAGTVHFVLAPAKP